MSKLSFCQWFCFIAVASALLPKPETDKKTAQPPTKSKAPEEGATFLKKELENLEIANKSDTQNLTEDELTVAVETSKARPTWWSRFNESCIHPISEWCTFTKKNVARSIGIGSPWHPKVKFDTKEKWDSHNMLEGSNGFLGLFKSIYKMIIGFPFAVWKVCTDTYEEQEKAVNDLKTKFDKL